MASACFPGCLPPPLSVAIQNRVVNDDQDEDEDEDEEVSGSAGGSGRDTARKGRESDVMFADTRLCVKRHAWGERRAHVACPLPAVSSPRMTLLRASASSAATAVMEAFDRVKGVGTSLILMKESCTQRGGDLLAELRL